MESDASRFEETSSKVSSSSSSETTTASSPARLGAIIGLLIFIAVILFFGWYLRQRNRTNRPVAIIANFGVTFTSVKQGKILSAGITQDAVTGDNVPIMDANGYRDPINNNLDVTCGWTLLDGKDPRLPFVDGSVVTIRNNFTQMYAYVNAMPLNRRILPLPINLLSMVPRDSDKNAQFLSLIHI